MIKFVSATHINDVVGRGKMRRQFSDFSSQRKKVLTSLPKCEFPHSRFSACVKEQKALGFHAKVGAE